MHILLCEYSSITSVFCSPDSNTYIFIFITFLQIFPVLVYEKFTNFTFHRLILKICSLKRKTFTLNRRISTAIKKTKQCVCVRVISCFYTNIHTHMCVYYSKVDNENVYGTQVFFFKEIHG